jgi:hypothetical protein
VNRRRVVVRFTVPNGASGIECTGPTIRELSRGVEVNRELKVGCRRTRTDTAVLITYDFAGGGSDSLSLPIFPSRPPGGGGTVPPPPPTQCVSAAEVVRFTYSAILLRTDQNNEGRAWVAALQNGTRTLRQMIRDGFLRSSEFHKEFVAGKPAEEVVRTLYQRLLRNEVDETGMTHWSNLIRAGR